MSGQLIMGVRLRKAPFGNRGRRLPSGREDNESSSEATRKPDLTESATRTIHGKCALRGGNADNALPARHRYRKISEPCPLYENRALAARIPKGFGAMRASHKGEYPRKARIIAPLRSNYREIVGATRTSLDSDETDRTTLRPSGSRNREVSRVTQAPFLRETRAFPKLGRIPTI
jgi:hypothetical protein